MSVDAVRPRLHVLSDRPGADGWRRFAWTLTGAFAADQISKWVAVERLAGQRPLHLFDWLHLTAVQHIKTFSDGAVEAGNALQHPGAQEFLKTAIGTTMYPIAFAGVIAFYSPHRFRQALYPWVVPLMFGLMLSHVVDMSVTGGALDWIALTAAEPNAHYAGPLLITNVADFGIVFGTGFCFAAAARDSVNRFKNWFKARQ